MISLKTLKTLEFDVILGLLSEFAVSGVARDAILRLQPSVDFDEIRYLCSLTDEAYLVREKYRFSPVIGFDDCTEILSKTRIGGTLSFGELLKVATVLRAGRIARENILSAGDDVGNLKAIASEIMLKKGLEKEITTKILSDSEMSDDASDKLRSIRRKLLSANAKLKERLMSYTKSSEISRFLQDNLVTIRNGRYVIPVRSESRHEIAGLIHDQSASGATVFIEPLPVVELNNELRSLQLAEMAEVERILSELSAAVGECYEDIFACQEIVTNIDVIFAKNDFSTSFNGVIPNINQKGTVNLIKSRHPLIAKDKVVPVSVKVGADYRLLLISGPNTGGKTVCLKTVGLFCLMTYIGLKIPCESGSEVSVFGDIFCDIGDEQSIMNSLSTFSSHMNNIVFITDNMKKDSLVLLDEIGGGTDPLEGAALAVGILKHIEKIGAVAVVTTHYTELKEHAFVSKNIENACMLFDEKTLKPSYKLVIGMPGTSNALRIAQNLGLNESIIAEAYSNIDGEKVSFENILKNAEEIKNNSLEEYQKYQQLTREAQREWERASKERKKLEEKQERFNFASRQEIKRYIAKSLEEADEIIDEIKKQVELSTEASLLEAKRLRKTLESVQFAAGEDDSSNFEYVEITQKDIVVGKKVAIKSLKMVGEIKSISEKNNEVVVSVGSIKTNVKIADLALPEVRAKQKPIQANIKKSSIIASNEMPLREIKVLGMTVAEALEVVEPIIYEMHTSNAGKTLKIVHGKGSGALGRGIQAYLRSENIISSYRYGRYGEGESGVTIVEIK